MDSTTKKKIDEINSQEVNDEEAAKNAANQQKEQIARDLEQQSTDNEYQAQEVRKTEE